MKKWFITVIIIALFAGAYFIYNSFSQAQDVRASFENIEKTTIEEGNLISTIDAIGQVRSRQSADLNWKTSGTVEAVNAAVGNTVTAGDILATLEETSLPQNVILAQSDLVSAQQALDDLNTSAQNASIKAMQEIAAYAQAVKDAQYQLDNYNVPADQADLDTMEALDLMKERLDQAREAFEPYKYYSSSNETRQELKETLDEAQSDYNAAVKRLDYEYELEVAQANLDQARADYDKWKDGPNSDETAAAEARIAAAEATLSQAWIEAPFDGAITIANPQTGDQVSANTPAFRLDDLSELLVDLEVSEIDINQIVVGQTVNLAFDAIRDEEYHGEVVEVAAVGNDNANVVDFTVTVKVWAADEHVRPGMTAEVEIVVSQGETTLLVPNQAILIEDGKQIVYIMESGQDIKPVEVTLGASSDTHSEILTGDLQAGDQIVLNPQSLEQPEETSGISFPPGDGDGQRPRMFGGDGGQE